MTAALAIVSFGGGIMYLSSQLNVDVGGTAMRVSVGIVLILASAALLGGLWASRHSSRSNGSLITAGAVPAAVCFWWTGIIPAVALSVAFFAVRRSRQQARNQKEVL